MRQVGLFMKVTVVWMDPTEQGGEGLCCYLLLLLLIMPESLQILLINIPLKRTKKPVFTFKIRSLWEYLTLALATIKIGSRGTFVVVKEGCVCGTVTFAVNGISLYITFPHCISYWTYSSWENLISASFSDVSPPVSTACLTCAS